MRCIESLPLIGVRAPKITDPLLSVKITWFRHTRQVTIGLTFNHVLSDARVMSRFVSTWTDICVNHKERYLKNKISAVIDRNIDIHHKSDETSKKFFSLQRPTIYALKGKEIGENLSLLNIIINKFGPLINFKYKTIFLHVNLNELSEFKKQLSASSSYETLCAMIIAATETLKTTNACYIVVDVRGRCSAIPSLDYFGNAIVTVKVPLSVPNSQYNNLPLILKELHGSLQTQINNEENLIWSFKWLDYAKAIGLQATMDGVFDIKEHRLIFNSWSKFNEPFSRVTFGGENIPKAMRVGMSVPYGVVTIPGFPRDNMGWQTTICLPKHEARKFCQRIKDNKWDKIIKILDVK